MTHLALREHEAERATAAYRGRGSRRPTGCRRTRAPGAPSRRRPRAHRSGCAKPHGPCRRSAIAPVVRRVNAREDLAERALARAVLAAERVARARGDLEADVVQRDDAGKALRDARIDAALHRRSVRERQVLRRHVGEAPRLQLTRPRAEVLLRDPHQLHRDDLRALPASGAPCRRCAAPRRSPRGTSAARAAPAQGPSRRRRAPPAARRPRRSSPSRGSRSVSSVCVKSGQPPIIAHPWICGYAFWTRITSAAASCGVSMW